MSDTENMVGAGAGKEGKSRVRVAGPMAPIASPMAGKKLHKKLYKVVKKAASAKVLKRGVKEVVKALRKSEKGLCVIAGDISPIDVISHIPGICEDLEIPYIYVNSKADLGAAAGTKRPTSVVLIAPKKGMTFDAADKMKECITEIKEGSTE